MSTQQHPTVSALLLDVIALQPDTTVFCYLCTFSRWGAPYASVALWAKHNHVIHAGSVCGWRSSFYASIRPAVSVGSNSKSGGQGYAAVPCRLLAIEPGWSPCLPSTCPEDVNNGITGSSGPGFPQLPEFSCSSSAFSTHQPLPLLFLVRKLFNQFSVVSQEKLL